jgi:hypothetical protein
VRTMAEVYGEAAGIVPMKDDAIRRAPAERDALAARNVRAFCLTRQLTKATGARHLSPG